MDRQSQAFRGATEEDVIDLDNAKILPPIQSLSEISLPEDFEHTEWDQNKETPKTLEEARTALLDRIVDPHAPDDESQANAYDDELT